MKKLIIWSVISAVLLVVCPVMCFNFMDDGRLLLVMILLVQFVYPLLSLICGLVSGCGINKLYSLPFINSGLFLLSIWLIYGEFDYLSYTGINLAISLFVMCIVAYMKKRIAKSNNYVTEVDK